MEVHKHPHHVTHKKKWGEYLLEFFMLFLAVFLGFVAENIRENIGNREIEEKNIESFAKNLQANQSTFEQMQSSGTLRLINHPNVLDSILKYETSYKQIRHQEDICSTWWNKSIEQVSAIIDITSLAQLPGNKLWYITPIDWRVFHYQKFQKICLLSSRTTIGELMKGSLWVIIFRICRVNFLMPRFSFRF